MRHKKFKLDDLVQLMATLRHPEYGCPWDLKQDYRSIAPSTLEEAYELVDAIEKENFESFREELGDLLFQVVFYSQLASEEQAFDFHDVVDGLVAKLIRRHPHVFPSGSLESAGPRGDTTEEQVKQSWEAIKRQERNTKGENSELDDVPVCLPSLIRAQKLQKRASSVGFDWQTSVGVWSKLAEELAELRAAINEENHSAVEEELGDVFFYTC